MVLSNKTYTVELTDVNDTNIGKKEVRTNELVRLPLSLCFLLLA